MIVWKNFEVTDRDTFRGKLNNALVNSIRASEHVTKRIAKKIARDYFNEEISEEIEKLVFLPVDSGNFSQSHISNINRVQVEYPYFDTDYLSTYYIFYAKKYKKFRKECCRLHLFYENLYYGYISLRPTLGKTKIGRSILSPNLFFNKENSEYYLMVSDFKCHNEFGQKIFVKAFPWMKQETDIAVCVHVAIWSALKYFGNKYSDYPNVNMGTIIDNIPELQYRKMPTFALHLEQTPYIFRKLGFSPAILKKNAINSSLFKRALYTYIESGIPIIAFTHKDLNHAVVIVGHGESFINDNEHFMHCSRNGSSPLFLYSSELISSLILNDDIHQPYHICSSETHNALYDKNKSNISALNVDSFDYLIIPLYERMQYSYEMVEKAVAAYVESERDFLNKQSEEEKINSPYIARIYITSANSLKEEMTLSDEVNDIVKTVILGMVLPKFVWCVDISTKEEYKSRTMSAKLIIDTTSNNFSELLPFLCIHNTKYIKYYDYSSNEWYRIDFEQELTPYPLYTNNLYRYPCESNGKYNSKNAGKTNHFCNVAFNKIELNKIAKRTSPVNEEYYKIINESIENLSLISYSYF